MAILSIVLLCAGPDCVAGAEPLLAYACEIGPALPPPLAGPAVPDGHGPLVAVMHADAAALVEIGGTGTPPIRVALPPGGPVRVPVAPGQRIRASTAGHVTPFRRIGRPALSIPPPRSATAA